MESDEKELMFKVITEAEQNLNCDFSLLWHKYVPRFASASRTHSQKSKRQIIQHCILVKFGLVAMIAIF